MLAAVGILSITTGFALIRAGILEMSFGDYLARALRLAQPAKPVQPYPGGPGQPPREPPHK